MASAVVTALTQELIAESSPVEVSIVAEKSAVELGNPANFVITADPAPATNQTINILIEKANTETTEISNEEIMLRAGEVSVTTIRLILGAPNSCMRIAPFQCK